jgi:hypothetical protein
MFFWFSNRTLSLSVEILLLPAFVILFNACCVTHLYVPNFIEQVRASAMSREQKTRSSQLIAFLRGTSFYYYQSNGKRSNTKR